MRGVTPYFSFYLPEAGDGQLNGYMWDGAINGNFTNIDAILNTHNNELVSQDGRITQNAVAIAFHTAQITAITTELANHEGRIHYLETHGGTGSGGAMGRVHVLGTVPSMTPGSTSTLDLDFAESCDLVAVSANHPCWIRVYSTAAARSADAARPITSDPIPGTGIMGEVLLYPERLLISWSPAPLFNNEDAILSKKAYLAITSTDPSYSGSIDLDFEILPQEYVNPGGPMGPTGLTGKSFFTSTRAPIDSDGQDGDAWFNQTTKLVYGPKSGGIWPAGVSLQGDPGTPGVNGLDGAPGLNGTNGTNGLDGAPGVSAFIRQTASYTTAVLPDAATETGAITLAKSADLFKVTCNHKAWVRIYVTDAARTADASRLITDDPAPGSGCILDVETASTITLSPVPTFFNADGTPTNTAYLAIKNTSGGSTAINLSIDFVPKES